MTASPRSATHDLTAEFDDFYRIARDRLVLQAFALTGDLVAARSGVRDAFVVTWHHWHKTFRSADPEGMVREIAWRNAQRRASTRRWRRDRSLDAEVCGLLDALADLPQVQRRLLVATQLAGMTMPEAARDVALPQEAAEQELAAGAATFARTRALDNSEIPAALAALVPATRSVRWPRVTIIRRAGAARRRAHTVAGAVAAIAALLITGVVVTDPSGARPLLDRDAPQPPTSRAEQPQVVLPDTHLLPGEPVRDAFGKRWEVRRTNDNSEGDGRVLACQQERYADPQGEAAWIRIMRDGPLKDGGRRVVQSAEASADEQAARRAYRTYRDWFAGCAAESGDDEDTPPQHRLVGTWEVAGVGDRAHLFLLRNDQTEITYVNALARTGRLVTVVSLETGAFAVNANRKGVAELLGTAVSRLCELPASGGCGTTPKLSEVPAFPAGDVPAMLSEWDLPPASDDTGPWVGPEARAITADNGELGVVRCSRVSLAGSFRGKPFRQGSLRSFVLPAADLPVEFGLSQMVASLPQKRAARLVQQVRDRIAGCPDTDAGVGTTVTPLLDRDQGKRNVTAWRLETELTDEETLVYDMAILRHRTSVSVLLFVSVPKARMSDEDFVRMTERAMERLREQPSYND